MKKENFTLDFNTPLKRIARLSILPVLLIMLSFQANAQCPLGCNNSVQISLDNDCQVTVTPDMILEGQGSASCNYTVEVLDANDNPIPNAVVDGVYIGQTLKARVLTDDGNSCWGSITIEDKLKPVLDCADVVEISCYSTYNPGLPGVTDNCDPNPTITILSDVTTDIDCLDPNFPTLSAQRVITYRAEDASGNVSNTCTQTVNYVRIGLGEIVFPDNLDNIEDDALSCDSYSEATWNEFNPAYPFFNVTGAPSTPDGANILPNNSLCELNATFSDQIITICESSFKVLRTFTVLDWCTGDVREEFQIIKILDNEPPLVTTLQDNEFAASADPYTCTADFSVPAPVLISDCSTWTYEIGYALAVNGMEPTDGLYYTTNVIGNATTGYTIVDLPLGLSWLRYLVTDACGNVTEAFTEVTVVDNVPPIAVCDEFTVVTLTSDGSAYAFAATFDDGSFDNCSPVTFSVRRPQGGCGSNNSFGDYVEFCCSDVGQDVMVELRVTEDRVNGLSNSCMVTVHVQDKIDPVITCPNPITIDCTVDFTDLSITGEPTGYDNCGGTITKLEDNVQLNDCGTGVIYRTWVMTDGGGRTDNCTQTITVTNGNVFNGNNTNMLRFPADVSLEGCMNQNTDEAQTGVPQINAGICSLVAYTSSDKVFNFQDGACFKILRTFTVIDWCQYDPDSSTPVGIWQRTQVIKLNNSIAPTFNGCTSTVDAPVTGANCNGFVTLTASATDDCPNVTEDELVFSYQFDQFNDGSINQSGNGNDASRILDVGQHRIIWSVEDKCGNQSTCEQVINVRDAKKPTPYCLSDITTVVMPTTGMIEIWASDFNLGSSDNCTDTMDLVYTFGILQADGSVNNTGSGNMSFDCDDVGMNDVFIIVTDEAGNSDYCQTTMNIQANSGCDGSRIAGAISTEVSTVVDQVEVMLEDMNTHEERYFMTDASGSYQFFNLSANVDYEVSATRNDNPTNGVSTLDLVLIQRHILGFSNLDSPYKIIAADINSSQTVSAADITELRKVILGVQPEFKQNNSWRFINGGQTFFDATEPWPLQERISVENFSDSAMDNNFVAIKIGDVNGTVTSNLNDADASEVRSSNTMLNVTNTIYKAGEEVRMDVRSDDFKAIAGLQFTLNFDETVLEYVGVEAAKLNINNSNIGAQLANRGEITASWNAMTDITAASNEVLMTVIFRAKTNGDLSSMTMSADQIISEAYTTELNITGLDIEVRDENAIFTNAEIVLQQNRPNPFTNTTNVSFTLVEAGTATLSIYDINGRLVNRVNDTFAKGANSINVNADDLNVSGGIFYYTLEANGQIATKKMILMSK